jgi:pimeloyl-ACP methyl ester carboxylesterase
VAWTWEQIRSVDHRACLSAIAVPTLIIHGSADADSPIEHAQWLADGLPNAELEVIDGAGHSLLSENTEAVVARMRAFLAGLESIVHNNKKESP